MLSEAGEANQDACFAIKSLLQSFEKHPAPCIGNANLKDLKKADWARCQRHHGKVGVSRRL
jgi:hypothetical protein